MYQTGWILNSPGGAVTDVPELPDEETAHRMDNEDNAEERMDVNPRTEDEAAICAVRRRYRGDTRAGGFMHWSNWMGEKQSLLDVDTKVPDPPLSHPPYPGIIGGNGRGE